MAKLRCQCGHKFLIDFERLTVQSARKVRCPECGQSFPLAEKNVDQPSSEAVVAPKLAAPSIMATLAIADTSPPVPSDDDEDDWPIAIPLSELKNDSTPTDKLASASQPTVTIVSWLAVITIVLILSAGVISNSQSQQSTIGLVVTNALLTGILFELWRIRRKLNSARS
jgi:DNA-directed RNA polymerase subunit RPC12/RpoP